MKARAFVHRKFTVGEVDKRIYGGFVEHIGRCVYDGIYEPGHPQADENGFRKDVAALVRDLDMPITRYPGGNFVSGYDWKDTIGPKDKRPPKADFAWKALEPNQVGIDEFAKWCRLAGTTPMMAVNLSTNTTRSAMELVEYCNFAGNSYWSNLRRANGTEKPHDIRLWCLGNEMDGVWEIGHKTATAYGLIANEAAEMMKLVDPTIEVVVCGSCTRFQDSFGSWDAEVLNHCYDIVDYISLHSYFGNEAHDFAGFFAMPEVLDKQIEGIIAVCDFTAAKRKSKKKLNLALDEWNIWYRGKVNAHPETEWQVARPINEEIYDMADVIVLGGLLMSMLDHADRLKIGCLAQSVNIIAPIMTRPGGGCWKQTIYYPFYYTSKYGRGTVLRTRLDSASYEAPEPDRPVPFLRATAVLREEQNELAVFALNRSLDEDMEFSLSLAGLSAESVAEAIEIHNSDLNAVNTETEEKVAPAPIAADRFRLSEDELVATLKPSSWNFFLLKLK